MAQSYFLKMDKREEAGFIWLIPSQKQHTKEEENFRSFPSLQNLAAEVVRFPVFEPLDRSDFWAQSSAHQGDLIQRWVCRNQVWKFVCRASVRSCRISAEFW
ncbi:hypothetical protein HanIR_Chr08g0385711 [Helianthus annuus]|nr:hypothetical protein HanIR_Chr08g0385711 [Helianthus annuus]